MKKFQDKENIDLNIDITPYENRIVIPKIWKNVPLVDIKNRNIEWQKELNNIFMKELEKGVVRYPGSALPWKKGSSFIFWHSSNFPWIKWEYNDVFALLDKVTYEDEIVVYYWQEKYVYKIKEKKVIKPGDVSVLESNQKKSEITLMTCWPIWTTINRLIVIWELVVKK
jgi:LPXTG-site transpeptidase (sortase) family protein